MHIPELALWRAVIDRAMRDAAGEIESGHFKVGTRNHMIREAQSWFRVAGEGYRAICDVADVPADKLRTIAMANFGSVPKRQCALRKRVLAPRAA